MHPLPSQQMLLLIIILDLGGIVTPRYIANLDSGERLFSGFQTLIFLGPLRFAAQESFFVCVPLARGYQFSFPVDRLILYYTASGEFPEPEGSDGSSKKSSTSSLFSNLHSHVNTLTAQPSSPGAGSRPNSS